MVKTGLFTVQAHSELATTDKRVLRAVEEALAAGFTKEQLTRVRILSVCPFVLLAKQGYSLTGQSERWEELWVTVTYEEGEG